MLVTERLRYLMAAVPSWTQQQALDALIWSACEYGHTLYSGDGHPIPRSSYLPRKGDLSGTLS